MSRERVNELLLEAMWLEDGLRRKTELLEEAVRLADSVNADDLAYDARMKLVPAANWSGDVDKMLVAFAWCVAKFEEDPAKHPSHQILWYSKWAALEAPRFPAVSRARVAQLLDDTERRFRDHGASLRPIFQQRHYAAVELGDLDEARVHYDRWWSEPRDRYADCAACEQSARLDWALVNDDDEGALTIAADLFQKSLRCAEVPHRIYGLMLAPLLKLGRIDEAKSAHRAGIRMLAKIEHNMAIDVARHAIFLALTGNHGPAVRVMSQVLPRAVEHRLPSTRANVFADLALVCDRLATAGKTKAALPVVAPFAKELAAHTDVRGKVDVVVYGQAAQAEAARIAALYDKRNGNDSFSRALDKKRMLADLAVDAPIGPRKATAVKRAGGEEP